MNKKDKKRAAAATTPRRKFAHFVLWFIASNYFPSNPCWFRLFNVVIYDQPSAKFSLTDPTLKWAVEKKYAFPWAFNSQNCIVFDENILSSVVDVVFPFVFIHLFIVQLDRCKYGCVGVLQRKEEKERLRNSDDDAHREKKRDVLTFSSWKVIFCMSFIHVDCDAFGRIENHLISCEQWKWKLIWFWFLLLFHQMFHARCFSPLLSVFFFFVPSIYITMRECNRSLNSISNLQKWIYSDSHKTVLLPLCTNLHFAVAAAAAALLCFSEMNTPDNWLLFSNYLTSNFKLDPIHQTLLLFLCASFELGPNFSSQNVKPLICIPPRTLDVRKQQRTEGDRDSESKKDERGSNQNVNWCNQSPKTTCDGREPRWLTCGGSSHNVPTWFILTALQHAYFQYNTFIHTCIVQWTMVMDRSVHRAKTIQNNAVCLQSWYIRKWLAASAPLLLCMWNFNA